MGVMVVQPRAVGPAAVGLATVACVPARLAESHAIAPPHLFDHRDRSVHGQRVEGDTWHLGDRGQADRAKGCVRPALLGLAPLAFGLPSAHRRFDA